MNNSDLFYGVKKIYFCDRIKKMNQLKISIIMPVYNTGEYLNDALQSIFAQSFLNFELICVDDSSNDELTRNILQTYQNQHENMQVIWLEKNVGAGIARNIGFSKAKGEYTIFLDADDMFAEEFLERMYQNIVINHADICICGYEEFYIDSGKKCFGNRYIPDDYKIFYNNREDWLISIPMAPWNKLCKTQFLIENKIYFQSLASCNDVFFTCMVMMIAKEKCYIKDTPLIFYRINSRKQISNWRNPIDLYKAIKLINDSRKNDDNDELYFRWISALLLHHGINEIKNCRNEIYNRKFYELLKKYFTQYSIVFENKMLSICIKNLKNNSYENKWFFSCTDLLYQLYSTAEELREQINKETQIFLWGLGYRGSIFEKFCMEQKIILFGIADIKNDNIGNKTIYGNKIVSTEYVLQNSGLIIAANVEIYIYLQKYIDKYTKKIRLLNLADYYVF